MLETKIFKEVGGLTDKQLEDRALIRRALEVYVMTGDNTLEVVDAVRNGKRETDLVVKSVGETIARAWMAWGGGANKDEPKGICVVAVEDSARIWPDLRGLLRASVQGRVGVTSVGMQTAVQNNFEQDSTVL